jgi:inhibitor of cysteine peptidase
VSRTYTSSDKEIAVPKGESFVIELESNPTTGYDWELQFDQDKIKDLDRQYVPAGEDVGGGGKKRFVLQAVKSGDASVRAIYKRAWEREPIDEKTFKIHITK